ncbi:NAD+ synthase [Pseudogemmobacter faecipullorum]|uniref:Glutamine-dependent NAD(+) synthetase n=1 Tax=Pseudogemmobacter faecipullorum TaxID=2755041 RepID=A0ABS8CNV8_9RHOB|nr:NAD+ synthase [Pseudogemmobacter faecipullorum]MCB5411059.1 NAD+ synthase [Pseudogemmobacter faecipullorum]
MRERFQLLMVQANPVTGDIAGNAAKARAFHAEGRDRGADFVVLTEMFITGYQTQDLVLKPAFRDEAIAAIGALARDCAEGPALGIGGPVWQDGALYNGYYILEGGQVQTRVLKHHLPNDAVFDEKRLFASADVTGPYVVKGVRIGSPICEDSWHPDVAETLQETGAEILIVPNGSPYHRGKPDLRLNIMVARVIETGLPLVYLNMVGGQDDQVFDGSSMVLNRGGKLAVQLPQFDEVTEMVSFTRGPEGWQAERGTIAEIPPVYEADYRACVLALGDYMRKSGFKKALLGLSGGIDSAIVAAMAADALGPENVHCIMLPSAYTSQHSLEDAAGVAQALGCRLDSISISGAQSAVGEALSDLFAGTSPDLTEENIQSRLRGVMLMAVSNKFGAMLLTTGNKSEVAVGYCTIYGDMNGGYNPIKDMYKTRVFKTARWRNANHRPWMKGPAGMVIPERVITKPPSAELRPDQKDEDSLPPYEELDQILEGLIEQDLSVADLMAKGFERETVQRIAHLVAISEYKRFQSAPGTRLTQKAFWLDRRYPIANRWRDSSGA